jgi:asparagine N-glycosylation enzyme membrane subunit Stt3
MIFWFLGTAVLAVWYVFRDPSFDYRLLLVGAVVPVVVDGALGGARVLHTVTFPVVLLAVLMLATSGRTSIRKPLLGLPIGLFLYLVFSGAWANAEVFWWPFTGFDFDDAPHPVWERGWWNIPLELVGIGLSVWIWRRADLGDRERRSWFARTGQLQLGS